MQFGTNTKKDKYFFLKQNQAKKSWQKIQKIFRFDLPNLFQNIIHNLVIFCHF